MDNVAFWAVVQTYSLQERRAEDNLRRQGFETLFPVVVEDAVPGVIRRRPMFPGYGFVLLPDDGTWGPINSSPGVIRLLTARSGDRDYVPQRVPDGEIAGLLACVERDDRGRPVVREGARVRVRTRGSLLHDREAVVKWSAGQRLGLLFAILGREVEVEFFLSDVDVDPADVLPYKPPSEAA